MSKRPIPAVSATDKVTKKALRCGALFSYLSGQKLFGKIDVKSSVFAFLLRTGECIDKFVADNAKIGKEAYFFNPAA